MKLRHAISLALGILTAAPVFAEPSAIDRVKLVADARTQVGVTLTYDPAYRTLSYPGGDVPLETGVCTDVVIRALRKQGLDLQKAVHEDMRGAFAKYPQSWGLRGPDKNIDHRRVPNLMTYFKRKGWSQPLSENGSDYLPGDVVTWNLGGGITHIGIVGDSKTTGDRPLILHNIGAGAQEEDILFSFKIIGHYRAPIAARN